MRICENITINYTILERKDFLLNVFESRCPVFLDAQSWRKGRGAHVPYDNGMSRDEWGTLG